MKALLITTTDLKKFSILDGNLDNDKFISYISISQDIHIQQYLGTDLLEAIQLMITNDTIDDAGNADYKELLETYIKPMSFLVYYSICRLFTFA